MSKAEGRDTLPAHAPERRRSPRFNPEAGTGSIEGSRGAQARERGAPGAACQRGDRAAAPRGPGEDLAGGGAGRRRRDQDRRVGQPGGGAHHGRPAPAGQQPGAVPESGRVPPPGRSRVLHRGAPPVTGARPGRDGASRGDPSRPSGRREDHDPRERDADLLEGRRDRVGRRRHPGHDAHGGAGEAAERVPGHGEPRTAVAPGRHQGIRGPPCYTRPRHSTTPRCSSSSGSSTGRPTASET